MQRFETPGPVTLKLSLAAGQVELETDAIEHTEVELVPLADDAATREALAEAQVGVRNRPDGGHEVYVEFARAKGRGITFEGFGLSFGPGRGQRVGIHVRCPDGTAVECSSSSTDVRGTGNFGDIVIKTASGDTFFEHVGDFEVNSASGDVGVRRAGGSVTINTASGDIELGTVDGPVKANSMSGDVSVGLARNSLTAQTVSGDQEISAITTGEVKLNSVSGDVRVGVVSGVKLWIDATSVSGEMRSELEVGDLPPPDDAEVVQLRAKTVSGDVNIVRAIGQVSA